MSDTNIKIYHKKAFLTDKLESSAFINCSIYLEPSWGLWSDFRLGDCTRSIELEMFEEVEGENILDTSKIDFLIDTLTEFRQHLIDVYPEHQRIVEENKKKREK